MPSSKNTGRKSHAMKTSEPSRQISLFEMESDPSTSSRADSRARTLASRESREEWAQERGLGYGQRLPDWLANYDPATSSWRTSQLCFVALPDGQGLGLAEFSETWPSAGMMLNGKTYQRDRWGLRIVESVYGLLPTPRKNDSQKRGNFDVMNDRNGFPAMVKRLFLPTLGKSEPKGSSRKRYRGSVHFRGAKMSEGLRICEEEPAYLSPCFAEAAMGFPIGWTELGHAETP